MATGPDQTLEAVIAQLPPDTLNESLGVLTRREVLAVLRDTVEYIAKDQGRQLREQMGGDSLQHFMDSLQFWTRDDALEIDVLEQSPHTLAFNVRRCRYAELYRRLGIAELGASLSCTRDFALIAGFNPKISLRRTQTIMNGAPYCDFRYTLET
jgi:hypothetical protein